MDPTTHEDGTEPAGGSGTRGELLFLRLSALNIQDRRDTPQISLGGDSMRAAYMEAVQLRLPPHGGAESSGHHN